MKIVRISNQDHEFYFEKEVCRPSKDYEQIILEALQREMPEGDDHYYALKEDDYKLYEFEA